MGLFDIFRRAPTKNESSAPAIITTDGGELGELLRSQKTITRDTAMMIPAVSAGIDIIASTFALIPFRLYRKESNGNVEIVTDDARVDMVNVDPRDTMDAYQMKKAVVEDYFLSAGGYIYIDRYMNVVNSLRYVRPEYLTINRNTDPIYRKYHISCNGKTYQPWNFIKLLRSTRDGMTGISILKEVQDALNVAYSILRYQYRLMAKGGNRKGFLQSSRRLGDSELKALKETWNNLYSDNSDENVAILNEGLTFKESANTAIEMQLNQTQRMLNDQINSILHISDDYTRFLKDAVQPVCVAFATALNRDLLTGREKKDLFWEADFTEVLKGDAKERFQAYQAAVAGGWITKNEIREKENLKRYDGLDVIDMKLSAVLFDVNTGEYYVPNTDKEGGTVYQKSSGKEEDHGST